LCEHSLRARLEGRKESLLERLSERRKGRNKRKRGKWSRNRCPVRDTARGGTVRKVAVSWALRLSLNMSFTASFTF
jgi:hypothetical protein